VCCLYHSMMYVYYRNSDPEYLGFPQDGIKVETKPKISNGVSYLMDKMTSYV